MKISIVLVLIFSFFPVSTICLGLESDTSGNDTYSVTFAVEPIMEVTKTIEIQGIWRIALDEGDAS